MNYYLLLILIWYSFLGIVRNLNIQTYIPGYKIDINGQILFYYPLKLSLFVNITLLLKTLIRLSLELTNQYFDVTKGIIQDCPSNCGSCIDQNTCVTCKFGYFQWSPVSNNNLYCIPCPLFNIIDLQDQILCADCVINPLTWQNTKKCTYSYKRIIGITNQQVKRYQYYQGSDSIKLHQVFQIDPLSQNAQVIEFVGGDSWCGYQLIQPNPPTNCYNINSQNQVDQSQTAVQCRVGYIFNFQNNICESCPINCSVCNSATQCLTCSDGYTLGANFQCVSCMSKIQNCQSCFYENSSQNNLVTNPFLSSQFDSEQSLLNSGYKLRCSQCSQTNTFYIPSLDMTSCEDCSTLSSCISCRYAKVDFGLVVDHSNSPYVVAQDDQQNYKKYCLACQDPFFVNYKGECEQCVDPNCEQCYYGSQQGTDSSYTLQQNFVYKTSQDNLVLKCAFCKYGTSQAALLLDGTCQQNLSFLATKDSNCAKWVQFKVLPINTMLDGTYFQCVECQFGAGFNASLPPQDRKCDQYSAIMNVPYCTSFYYITVDGKPQAVTCTRCEKGYVATATRGCVSCSNGIKGVYSMGAIQQGACNGCSLMTPSGFNYTYYLITQTAQNYAQAVEIETDFNLPIVPFCTYCHEQKVYGTCPVSCFNDCYTEKDSMGNLQYNACVPDSIMQSKCIACGNSSPYQLPWHLDQSVSSDYSQCIECPRYCLFCQQRTQDQKDGINPYYKPGSYSQLLKYANQCITCRSISDICSDFSDNTAQYQGYQLDCTQQGNYVMYYDPIINQCTPCPIDKPNCTRKLKIQQLVECRPNISVNDQNLGTNQNSYYQMKLGGMGQLSHIFDGIGTIFLDSWNPTTTLNINFSDFNSLDDNLQTYYALNEENIAEIEFEILLIPNVQKYTTNDGYSKDNANVCFFPNDVNFSLKLAQYIANINKLSLTFKTVNPTNGQIGQDPLDLFISSFSFQGWNYFNFENINFLPMYSIKTSVQVKNMLFDFSNNHFLSQLVFKNVIFMSGFDNTKQQTLLKQAKTIFCPVIDLYNVEQITMNNVQVYNFYYQKFTSFFRFNQDSGNKVSILLMNINNFIINNCQFQSINLFQLLYKTTTISMNSVTISNSLFTNSIIFNQLPGHNLAQSQHSLSMNNLVFQNNQFVQSSILNAYNLLAFKVTGLSLNFNYQLQYNTYQPLITTNTAVISTMQLTSNLPNQGVLTVQNATLFAFPVSSSAAAPPSITLDQLTVTSIQFTGSNGYIMNLVSYQNIYSVRGTVSVSNLKIQNCKGDSYLLNLFYFSSVRLVTFNTINMIDSVGLSFIYSEYSDQISITSGSISNSQLPEICKNGPLPSIPTLPTDQFHGTMLSVKNLRTRSYMFDITFQNLCIIDRVLFYFAHDQRDPRYMPETLNDPINQIILQNANTYTQFDQKISTAVVFNSCQFKTINAYVFNSNIISTLFYFSTNLQYVNLLVSVTASKINIFQVNQDTLFKSSSSFMIQDSNPSFMVLVGLSLSNINSAFQIQNGILFNGNIFACISCVFDSSNYGQEQNSFGYQGGFLNLQAKAVVINYSKFSKSVSDQGGAIYIKTYSTSASIQLLKVDFIDIKSSFSPLGSGVGGAISIDGTSSLTLTMTLCTFDQIFAYKKGAVLDLTCGQGVCKNTFDQNTISNVFAPTGSIFNVKLNKQSQSISFTKNTYSSTLTIDNMINKYAYFQFVDSELQQAISQFYIMYIQGGSITFEDNVFDGVNYLQGLIYATGGIIQFNRNTFTNSNFRFTPFVYFYKQGITQFTTTVIQNIKECVDCQPQNNQLYFLTNYTLTNFNNFFLIESSTQSVQINDITIQNVVCSKCTQGILGFQSSQKPVQIQGGKIENNVSNQGSIYIGGSPNSSSRILSSQQNLAGTQFTINNIAFQQNTANLGGAIYVSYNNLQLISCTTIQQNTAAQGGAIYFLTSDSNPNTLILQSSTISKNQAKIGGGIKIIGTFPQLLQNSVVNQNTASVSGKDLTSYPTGLKVYQNKVSKPYDSSKGAVLLNQWSPGVSVDQELFIYLTGEDGKIQKLDSGQTATLTVSLNYPSNSQIPPLAKITGATTVNYDSIIGGFYLNSVQFQQQPLSQLLAKLESSIIKIPQFDSSGALISIDTSYNLPLIINTRYCKLGEAFIQTSGQCYLCGNNTYSIIDNSTQCLDCPKQGVSSCPGANVLNLQSGYWRPSYDSDKIEDCVNSLSNCVGGKGTGDQLCAEGHIGALCEVCDISARFWLESYSNSNEFSCGKCKDTSNNTLKMVGLSIYTLIAIFFSVKSTKELLDSYIITFYFQKIGFIQKSAKQSTENVGIVIKLFTTYLQLILVITTFNLQLPPGLSDITMNIGDPVKQMSFSMDCALQKMSGGIPMTYFRLIWSQLMPLLYVIFYLIGHFIWQKVKKIQNRAVIAWIAFIYIYISMQPSVVKQNIQTISCRQISGIEYIKANVSEECYTSEHIKYMLILILPSLAIWVFLIPIFFIKKMYDGRDKLDKIEMQYKFGFLYTEYKKTSYFWEIVKVYQKTFITFFINIYDSYNIVKGVLVIIVLIIYIRLWRKYQPYLERRFNLIDLYLNLTVIASIIIAMFIQQNPFSYLVWFGYIILVTINSILIIMLIRILVSGYTYKFEAKIGEKLVQFSIKHPKIARYFNLPLVRQERVKHLWNLLRLHFKEKYLDKEEFDNKKMTERAGQNKFIDSKNKLIDYEKEETQSQKLELVKKQSIIQQDRIALKKDDIECQSLNNQSNQSADANQQQRPTQILSEKNIQNLQSNNVGVVISGQQVDDQDDFNNVSEFENPKSIQNTQTIQIQQNTKHPQENLESSQNNIQVIHLN
ncbi:transmembrane protein, putative (macronuclear) [Tetrahymena thermophila SB210]|uniref:Transmembrane protein, putative n=1 Tax=Tetrahymena thermophila (strain SB210) TaxID=312017 RepID=I7M1R3_TETTS|nr:transmembrane protein, putative [Tetrahymena thermophila SB210]EAR97396.3 transmembrane protein, putative [Tetrahymena thermophila SB210]|eukprot:XP_001017641.3 transmembrane protein, putative [Tetrahymena thermophila SB210]